VQGEYVSGGTIDVLGYRSNEPAYLPGTSVRGTREGTATGAPEVLRGLEDLTRPVGTRDAWMPRGYLIPAEDDDIARKLEAHGVVVSVLEAPMRAEGEEFAIRALRRVRSRGYDMRVLDGEFAPAERDFPAGTYFVDMAQPMANAAFYYLEPESSDGFVGWGVLDDALRTAGADRGPAVYPIFKLRRDAR
jgi:hypothetical protein